MTSRQEIFAKNIVQGKSQRVAYNIAYPRSKKWKKSTLDTRASQLIKNENVQLKIKELQQIEDNEIKWTRKKAVKELLYILNVNEEEMNSIIETYRTAINLKQDELNALQKEYKKTSNKDIDKKINRLRKELFNLKTKPTTNSGNTKYILDTIKILNRMYGYDITKVEIQETDEERENMKALTKEELKAIAYANMNNK